jgi:glycosyltransferase involved in cell wall biosynthesis
MNWQNEMCREPALSVVVATYERAEIVRETLRRLADQVLDPSEYEVIVVDDGSRDHTSAVVEEWTKRASYRLRYIYHSNHGPGYAQNRGIEAAAAPIVLLIADDIFAAPAALKMHLDMHKAHPQQEVAVVGRLEELPPENATVFLRNWVHWPQYREFRGLQELPYYRFMACNISAKRDFLLRHGPYREQMGRAGPAAHEDVQLGYQLSLAGLRILYCPEALGFHHHPTTFAAACGRRYMQGLNFGEFHLNAPVPEIPVVYHILSWWTLADHFRALLGSRRRYLMPADRNPAKLAAWHLLRAVVFNSLTVPWLWEPMVNAAERSATVALFAHWQIYRGILFYHFLRGCRDGHRMYDKARLRLPQAGTTAD